MIAERVWNGPLAAAKRSQGRPGSLTETNKALLRRWYDEMWSQKNFDLIPELAGPTYTRHDPMGRRTVTAEEYRDECQQNFGGSKFSDMTYWLMSEGDYVTAIGSWLHNGDQRWSWGQTFRIEDGRLVETWLPALAIGDSWDAEDVPTAPPAPAG